MGEIKTTIDRSRDLTTNTASGSVTMEDVLCAAKGYLAEEPTKKVLWDFQDADGSGISGADIRKFYETLSKHPTISKPRKIALVVSRDLGHGLLRMSEAYAKIEAIPADYYLTHSLEEAMRWLDGELSAQRKFPANGEDIL